MLSLRNYLMLKCTEMPEPHWHKVQMAVYNHWTGLVDWTSGLDWWTDIKNHFYAF